MFLVPLTKKQKKLIKLVVKLQLDNLYDILYNRIEDDTAVYCALNELDYQEFQAEVKNNIMAFDRVHKSPCRVGTLDKDNVAILKTLMFKYYDRPKYRIARYNIWRKLDRAHMNPINLN